MPSKKSATKSKAKRKQSAAADSVRGIPKKWRLRLYVAGNTPNSIAAFLT